MAIADEDVATVRTTSDIVAIVTQYLQLRRVGRRWVGLCPFHQERTPSFSVNAEENLWYCFGCQASGDVITFVREVEGLDFVGAVEWLAHKAGVTLRYTSQGEGADRRRRSKLIEVMVRAVDWYHERLLSGADAGAARSYLRSRGLDGDVVREYKLGWAPGGWDELCRGLKLDEGSARDTGLGFRNSRNRLQDTFRDRVLFPIADAQGNPVSFGGRLLPGVDDPHNRGKYKNTPETPLYHKSSLLYGLDRAKTSMVSEGTAVICEGYTDVIGFHRSGVTTAVATCGTALTEDHVKLLRRYGRRLVLAFDADNAGQAAAERLYNWERQHDLDVLVADLPQGTDPADVAQSEPDRLKVAVEEAKPFMRFRLDRVFAAHDLSAPEGRGRAAEAALALVAEHPDPVMREQYLMDVAGRCRMPDVQLRPTLDRLRRGDRAQPRRIAASPSPEVTHETLQPAEIRDSPALEVLRHAVHNPGEVSAWIDVELFGQPAHRQAVLSMFAVPTLQEAIEHASGSEAPGAALLLRRLSVDEPTSEPFEAVRRLLTEVARRELAGLQHAADAVNEPDGILADSRFLSESINGLRAGDEAQGAADRLVAWLRQRVGDGG